MRHELHTDIEIDANRLQPAGGREATFKPSVTVVEPNTTFEWLGRFGLPGIFDGRHRFELTPTHRA